LKSGETLFVRPSSGLVKMIGPWTCMFFGITPCLDSLQYTTLSSLPQMYPGMSLGLTLLIAGILVTIEATSFALIMLAMPRSGGGYIIPSRGINPGFGMMELWRTVINNPMNQAVTNYFTAYAIGNSLVIIGQILHNPGVISAGTRLMTPENALSIGIILTIVACLFALLGPTAKIEPKWYAAWGIIAIIAWIMNIASLALSAGSIQRRWDYLWGDGAYEEVLKIAKEAGYQPVPFNWNATILALPWPITLSWPYNIMQYAGEVTEPDKNIPLATIGSAIVLGAFYTCMAIAFESSIGKFANMYSFILASGHGDKLTINPRLPMTNFAVWSACLAPAWLSPFLVLAPLYAGLGSLTIYIAYVARPLFAAAFDRLLPAKFAELSRYGTPKYGILFHLIATIIFLVPCYFGFVITGAVSFLITYAFVRWMDNLAAALLPYIKPHLYKTSIRRQPEVAGIPLITICGTIASLVLLFMVFLFASVTPITSMFFVAATYTFGVIWFIAYANRLRKMDIDVDKIFSVLPPA